MSAGGSPQPPEWRLSREGSRVEPRLTGDWIAGETGVRGVADVRRIVDETGDVTLCIVASGLGLIAPIPWFMTAICPRSSRLIPARSTLARRSFRRCHTRSGCHRELRAALHASYLPNIKLTTG